MNRDTSLRKGDSLELYTPHQPELIIVPTPEQVDQIAAQHVIEQVLGKQDLVLILPTGNTPIGMYDIIANAYAQGAVSFSKARIFNLDEYWPLPWGHPDSYFRYMQERFYTRTDIDSERYHIPHSHVNDPEFEAYLYETLLQKYGPADLAVVGIGPGLTCHIGFNEKGSAADSRTRLVELSEETIAENKKHFSRPEDMPRTALTMGIANILATKRVILLAKGEGKAAGIQRTLEGGIGADAPASFLRFHPNATFIMDRGATHLLSIKP